MSITCINLISWYVDQFCDISFVVDIVCFFSKFHQQKNVHGLRDFVSFRDQSALADLGGSRPAHTSFRKTIQIITFCPLCHTKLDEKIRNKYDNSVIQKVNEAESFRKSE